MRRILKWIRLASSHNPALDTSGAAWCCFKETLQFSSKLKTPISPLSIPLCAGQFDRGLYLEGIRRRITRELKRREAMKNQGSSTICTIAWTSHRLDWIPDMGLFQAGREGPQGKQTRVVLSARSSVQVAVPSRCCPLLVGAVYVCDLQAVLWGQGPRGQPATAAVNSLAFIYSTPPPIIEP